MYERIEPQRTRVVAGAAEKFGGCQIQGRLAQCSTGENLGGGERVALAQPGLRQRLVDADVAGEAQTRRFQEAQRFIETAAAAQCGADGAVILGRSEEHTSELQSLMRISYAVFCLKKQPKPHNDLSTS